MSGDIFAMLCMLDEKLAGPARINTIKRGKAGDPEILDYLDHGHNHAGPGKCVEIRGLLKSAGYRVGRSIVNPKDVVLLTCGIESWAEIHNLFSENRKDWRNFSGVWKGVDLLTARLVDCDQSVSW